MMSLSIRSIVKKFDELVARGKQPPQIFPGDQVIFVCDDIGGDIPLTMPDRSTAIERSAFTGSLPFTKTTGWIRTGEAALVIAVLDEQCFLLPKRGDGWGWIDTRFLVALVEYSRVLKKEATNERRKLF